MAIRTSVGVRDNMSAAFMGITGAINTCLGAFMDLQNSTNEGLSPAQFEAVQPSLYQMNDAARQFADGLNDADNEQKKLNNSMARGSSHADGLLGKIKSIAGAYIGIKTATSTLGLSDEMTTTAARIDMMNDGLQTTEELQNMIMASAQNARGLYLDMAESVAKLGNNAGEAFGNNSAQIVEFANLVQKQFAIAGASATESSNAMLQLTQALGSGVLRGDELNSIFEQAPNLIRTIADYMGVSVGEIRGLASEGKISADIVKNAMFASADDINAKFNEMPMTWGQIWTNMQNQALAKFQPILQKLNDIANSGRFQNTMSGLINGLAIVANVATAVFDGLVSGAAFVQDNWSVIEPIFWGIAAAVGAYAYAQALCAGISGIMAIAEGVRGAATMLAGGATFTATAAQHGFNAALFACPITWIVAAVFALVAAVIAVCQWIANATGVASSWFGVMTGGVSVVIAFFKNLGLTVANIALGIWNAMGACCTNIGVAFHNTIAGVQSWFYNLLSTALSVISGICEALNQLPFIEFDFSGITNAAAEYANKAAEADGSKEEYADVGAAFSDGFGTFDTFQGDWAGDAFKAGAEWGDGIADSVGGMLDGLMNPSSNGMFDASSLDGSMGGFSGSAGLDDIANNTGATAANTAAAKEITEENMAWMKDIAEREVIDRTVFKDISVNLGGVNNTVNNMADLDGVADYLGNVIQEQMLVSAEGVHA